MTPPLHMRVALDSGVVHQWALVHYSHVKLISIGLWQNTSIHRSRSSGSSSGQKNNNILLRYGILAQGHS